MRLLILGGTQFLGRAIAVHACAAGHEVTCAARGISGAVSPGVRFVKVDRDVAEGLAPLTGETFDAVIDVARHPGQVRRAVPALKHHAAHWTFSRRVAFTPTLAPRGNARVPPRSRPRPPRKSSTLSRRPTAMPRWRASRRSAPMLSYAAPG